MPKGVTVWGDEVRKIREERFFTQDEFGRAIGVSMRNIQRLESTLMSGMGIAPFRKLAELLKATPEGLAARLVVPAQEAQEYAAERKARGLKPGEKSPIWKAGHEPKPRTKRPSNVEIDQNIEMLGPIRQIPLFEISLAAGPWADVTEVPEITDLAQIEQGLFRVRLSGDSMQPRFKSGEIVEFRILRRGRREGADLIEPGKDYYIQKSDGTATFKRVEKATQDELTLRAVNRKKYAKPMPVEMGDIVRIAKAVAKVELLE